jgi:NADH-quinone oxidoreductase subunit E
MVDEKLRKRSGILEALHKAQDEDPQHYISPEKMKEIAVEYGVSLAEASGIASFYHFYSTKPRGKYIIRVCESLPCRICGSVDIYLHLQKKLGISAKETTRDGLFTLEVVNCIGNCDKSPTITINDELYSCLSPESIDELIDSLTQGGGQCQH